jgi:hypothetical protein
VTRLSTEAKSGPFLHQVSDHPVAAKVAHMSFNFHWYQLEDLKASKLKVAGSSPGARHLFCVRPGDMGDRSYLRHG